MISSNRWGRRCPLVPSSLSLAICWRKFGMDQPITSFHLAAPDPGEAAHYLPAGASGGLRFDHGNAANIASHNIIGGNFTQHQTTHIHYGPGGAAVPANQLPPPPADFVGREKARAQLTAALTTLNPRFGLMCSVHGMGGIGKTALAVWIGHAVAAAYPDGRLFIELAGSQPGPQRSLSEALRQALWPFIGHQAWLPTDLAGVSALYRQTLNGRRVLVVLDDVPDAEAVRYFVPPAGCALLITSRSRLIGQEKMATWAMGPLRHTDAQTLLFSWAPQLAGNPLVPDLLARCDYLPLTIRQVGAVLAERPSLTIERCLALLDNHAAFAAERQFQRQLYAQIGASDLLLAQEDPLLADRWRLLHVCEPEFPAEAAAAIWAEPDCDITDAHLEELCRRSLLRWNAATRRYALPNILRDIARQRCETSKAAVARGRFTGFVRRVVSRANQFIAEAREPERGLALLAGMWPLIIAANDALQRDPATAAEGGLVGPALMLAVRIDLARTAPPGQPWSVAA